MEDSGLPDLTLPAPIPMDLRRRIHDSIREYKKTWGRVLPESFSVALTPADLESINSGPIANPGSLRLFGLPVIVITPEIQSQIDGIQAFRAAHGEPKARRFGLTYHEDTPIVFPMEN